MLEQPLETGGSAAMTVSAPSVVNMNPDRHFVGINVGDGVPIAVGGVSLRLLDTPLPVGRSEMVRAARVRWVVPQQFAVQCSSLSHFVKHTATQEGQRFLG
jgi:hypothetical protein